MTKIFHYLGCDIFKNVCFLLLWKVHSWQFLPIWELCAKYNPTIFLHSWNTCNFKGFFAQTWAKFILKHFIFNEIRIFLLQEINLNNNDTFSVKSLKNIIFILKASVNLLIVKTFFSTRSILFQKFFSPLSLLMNHRKETFF